MKFATALFSAATLVASVSAFPVRRDVDPNLIPQLGFTAGQNPDGTGNCDGAVTGANGKPVQVPCACPPSQASFDQALNTNVAAGKAVNNPSIAVSFPTDNSTASQEARINAALVTLQNLNGPGQGCPAASTTLVAQQKAVQSGGSASSAAAAAPASSSAAAAAAPASSSAAPAARVNAAAAPASSAAASTANIAALAPQLGATAGKNPDGTGNCDGAVNGANGQPVKVPCSCPPDQQDYIGNLTANVAAGKAVNNPSIAVSFPTDNSTASQSARINAALVTLQNLNGPGKGCPAASTTLVAQQKALQG